MIKSYFCEECKSIHYGDIFYNFYKDNRIIVDEVITYYNCPKCNNMAVEIDVGIINIIQKLNIKGYKTIYSCEGHFTRMEDGNDFIYNDAHIIFDKYICIKSQIEKHGLPKYWEYEVINVNDGDICDSIRTSVNLKDIDVNMFEFDQYTNNIKYVYLSELEAWVDSLDDISNIKAGVVISAFPGTGKSWMTNVGTVPGITDPAISDSDSSSFSWIVDEDGNKVRNPEFPDNYIKHIKSIRDTTDIIFVSSHEIVRDALIENGIDFYIIIPHKNRKEEFIELYKQRGNTTEFVETLSKKWDEWLDEIEKFAAINASKVKLVTLDQNKFIGNSLAYIQHYGDRQVEIRWS